MWDLEEIRAWVTYDRSNGRAKSRVDFPRLITYRTIKAIDALILELQARKVTALKRLEEIRKPIEAEQEKTVPLAEVNGKKKHGLMDFISLHIPAWMSGRK